MPDAAQGRYNLSETNTEMRVAMTEKLRLDRRSFLKQAAGAVGARATQAGNLSSLAPAQATPAKGSDGKQAHADVELSAMPVSRTAIEDDFVSAGPRCGCGQPWPGRARATGELGDIQQAQQRVPAAVCVSGNLGAGGGWEACRARARVAHPASV